MPELPEVEITRRELHPHLVGRQICEVLTSRRSYFFLTPPATLRKKLAERTVVALGRHGKYLLARLDDASTLLLHLGMTGRIFPHEPPDEAQADGAGRNPGTLPEHTHVCLRFADSGPDVHFRDVRKFGKIKWIAPHAKEPRIEQLGVDALSARAEDLRHAAQKRRTPIKTLLLDQGVLAGVGNIYADEALFLARVRPTRSARRVTATECALIVDAAQQVMLRAIEAGGSTLRDFAAPSGQSGRYQQQHLVYGHTAEPCSTCGTVIRRIVIATRSSHYCPACQK